MLPELCICSYLALLELNLRDIGNKIQGSQDSLPLRSWSFFARLVVFRLAEGGLIFHGC